MKTPTEHTLEALERLKKTHRVKSDRQFCRAIGLDTGQFSRIKSGLESLPDRYIDIISDQYNINKKYILFGEGNVFNEKTEEELHSQSADLKKQPSINKESKGVPYYDVDFIGGFDIVLNSQQVRPAFYIDFMPFNDADYYVNVTGKSMGPLIAHGDIVALQKVEDWKSFLLEGEIYAVVTNNGFRTIKIIGRGETPENYTLIPYNKNGDYKEQPIPKNVITHIFRVKGAMKRFF